MQTIESEFSRRLSSLEFEISSIKAEVKCKDDILKSLMFGSGNNHPESRASGVTSFLETTPSILSASGVLSNTQNVNEEP